MQHDNKTTYEDLVRLDARWAHDSHAPDGRMAGGWRIVKQGGWVKAFGAWWNHDRLIPFVGERVWIASADYWQTECDAYESRRRAKSASRSSCICRLTDSADKRGR